MRKKIIIGAVIAVLIVAIVGINLARGNKENVLSVKTATVQKNDLTNMVYTSGQFAPGEEQKVYAKTNGLISEVKVKAGDKVKKGDLLVVFDKQDILKQVKEAEASLNVQVANLNKERLGQGEAEINQSKARVNQANVDLESAKRKLARSKTLYEQDAISKEEYEQAQDEVKQKEAALVISQNQLKSVSEPKSREVIAALEAQVTQAKVSLDTLREQLSKTELRAEINGVVLSLDAEKDKFMSQGALVASIGNLDSLKITVDVSEGDSTSLSLDQKTEITSTSALGEKAEGKIVKISPMAVSKTENQNQKRNVIPIEIMTKANPKFKPGLSADINIITDSRKQVLTVPLEAIVEEGNKKFVYIVENETVKKQLITTGLSNELSVEVMEGLKDGQKVVVTPPPGLKDKSKVKLSD